MGDRDGRYSDDFERDVSITLKVRREARREHVLQVHAMKD